MAKSKKGFFENPGSDNNLNNPNVQIKVKETIYEPSNSNVSHVGNYLPPNEYSIVGPGTTTTTTTRHRIPTTSTTTTTTTSVPTTTTTTTSTTTTTTTSVVTLVVNNPLGSNLEIIYLSLGNIKFYPDNVGFNPYLQPSSTPYTFSNVAGWGNSGIGNAGSYQSIIYPFASTYSLTTYINGILNASASFYDYYGSFDIFPGGGLLNNGDVVEFVYSNNPDPSTYFILTYHTHYQVIMMGLLIGVMGQLLLTHMIRLIIRM
jgi:hypothetical protein